MTSRRPPSAARGMPPPMTLPNVMMSGFQPVPSGTVPSASRPHHPAGPTRKPVRTSSTMSSAPCACVISASARLKPGSGASTPMFAAADSTITAAMRSECSSNAARTASRSLYGSTRVCAAVSAVMPALPGRARVATPEPASASSESEWPW